MRRMRPAWTQKGIAPRYGALPRSARGRNEHLERTHPSLTSPHRRPGRRGQDDGRMGSGSPTARRRDLARHHRRRLHAQVYPPPPHDPHLSAIAENNLTAVWANYTRLGYHRLICTNTLSTLPDPAPTFHRAMGANVCITRVLLTATDTTTHERLSSRCLFDLQWWWSNADSRSGDPAGVRA